MRFVIVMQLLTEALEKITIVPPCRGYYTNISIQNSSTIGSVETAVSETEKMDHLFLGVNVSEFVIADIADVVTEGQGTGPFVPRVRGDIDHDYDHIYQKFIYPGFNEAGASQTFSMQHKHFGKKRLRIKNDSDLLTLLYKSDVGTVDGYLLIQGNFIPTKGAIFKQIAEIGGLLIAGDWDSANRFLFTTDLSRVQIKVTVNLTFSSAEYAAITYFRIRRHGDVEFTDTVATPRGDILDDDFVDQDNISAHGIIGQLSFITSSDATSRMFDVVLNVGNVKEGDYLSWDTKLVSGTEGGGNQATITVAGMIPFQGWCEEADFIQHADWYDINRDINGRYALL